MGLLNEVTAPADLMDRAYDYARRIAVNAPLSVRKTKESVLRGLATNMDEAYRIESADLERGLLEPGRHRGPQGLRREAHPQLAGSLGAW